MNLSIRKWKEKDVDELVQLNHQWGYPTTKETVAANLKRIDKLGNAGIFVADLDSRVTGFIYVMEHIIVGGEPFAEVHGLVVDENFRKRGIGKALIGYVKTWSTEKGLTKLRLRTNLKREEANIFYPKIGFAVIKQQNVYEIRL